MARACPAAGKGLPIAGDQDCSREGDKGRGISQRAWEIAEVAGDGLYRLGVFVQPGWPPRAILDS